MALVAILSVRVHGLMYRKCVASPISTTFMQSHVTTAPPPQCAAFTSIVTVICQSAIPIVGWSDMDTHAAMYTN